MKTELRNAQPLDWDSTAALLTQAGLPLEGAHDHFQDFVLAIRNDELVGCAGLERYEGVGLLRSVAVKETLRGQGLGQQLTAQVLANARAAGLTHIVLLTETAQNFFPRFGFETVSRSDVPKPALASVEFTTACPDTATVMRLKL